MVTGRSKSHTECTGTSSYAKDTVPWMPGRFLYDVDVGWPFTQHYTIRVACFGGGIVVTLERFD